ncbi:hypothetical protein L195_g021923 [Trifolium pratense]|uniref:Uncharacterized protein n=1 Tax=Trifolium pratense TaxID=57577 RepID=A0A2K3N6P9_TRIPR|nr:hypothetical protein L195_g021923 [Trifolium pratense]
MEEEAHKDFVAIVAKDEVIAIGVLSTASTTVYSTTSTTPASVGTPTSITKIVSPL